MSAKLGGSGHKTLCLPEGSWARSRLLVIEYVVALFFFDSEQLPVGAEHQAVRVHWRVDGAHHRGDHRERLGWRRMVQARDDGRYGQRFANRRLSWPALVAHLLAYALALVDHHLRFQYGARSWNDLGSGLRSGWLLGSARCSSWSPRSSHVPRFGHSQSRECGPSLSVCSSVCWLCWRAPRLRSSGVR